MKRKRLAPGKFPYSKSFVAQSAAPAWRILRSLGKAVLVLLVFLLCVTALDAQEKSDEQKQAEYTKVITERSAKIVNTLGITDSNKYNKVLKELVSQYTHLNSIHDGAKASVTAVKSQSLSKEEREAALTKLEAEKSSKLLQRHAEFIAHLQESLTEAQIELVKDGMTYRVFPVTYASYQDMLLNLTEEQKQMIYSLLKEARELAMDEGSSDDKHKVFGKYKGRINNNLSAAGYDLKKETAAWQQRIRDRKTGAN